MAVISVLITTGIIIAIHIIIIIIGTIIPISIGPALKARCEESLYQKHDGVLVSCVSPVSWCSAVVERSRSSSNENRSSDENKK